MFGKKKAHEANQPVIKHNADFSALLEHFAQSAAPGKIIHHIDGLLEASRAAGEAARDAEKAYYADVETRKQKISDRIVALNTLYSALQTRIDAFKHPLTEATVSGDTDALNRIRDKIKALEVEKASTQSEKDMLKTTNLRGDVTLHDDVVEKNNQYLNLAAGVQESMKAFANCLDGYIERFTKIAKEYNEQSRLSIERNTIIGHGANMDALEKQYDPEGYEAKKHKILEERRAKAAARGGRIAEDLENNYFPEVYKEYKKRNG